jgi:hypothetical protein
MLAPEEFFPGCLRDAGSFSLFLPRRGNDFSALVVNVSGALTAVVLEGNHQFLAFRCSDNVAWRGILVPNVSIEVDEGSVIDLDRYDVPQGALIRRSAELCIAAREEGGFRIARTIPLIGNLPAGPKDADIGFAMWRIILGRGQDKRELKTISVKVPNG